MNIKCGPITCPLFLDSACVFYQGDELVFTNIQTGNSVQTAIQKIDSKMQTIVGSTYQNGITQTLGVVEWGGPLLHNTFITGAFSTRFDSTLEASALITTGGTPSEFVKGDGSLDSTIYVPESRILTINSISYDLSADRTWNITATGGTSGTSGVDGTSGTSGSTGGTGTSGTSGTSSTSGTSGNSGSSGTSGLSGTSGSSGINGTSGNSGSSGSSGLNGSSGTSGNNGTSGTSGNTGTSGTTGTSGSSGSSPPFTVKDDANTSFTQRPVLRFMGTQVVQDDSGNTATNIISPGADIFLNFTFY